MCKINNIVIVAGGKNTRFKEMSIFPKILLPMNDYPSILSKDCDLFKDKTIYLIINSDYEQMTKDYINNNHLNVKLLVSHNANGSSNTLKALYDKLPRYNTLLIWSDLILSNEAFEDIQEGLKNLSKRFAVITKEGNYRFKIENNQVVNIEKNELGNVPGIYYYKIAPIFDYKENDYSNYDFIEYIRDFHKNKIEEIPLKETSNIFEFRDLEIYLKYYLNDNILSENTRKTRFFNSITKIDNNTLCKKCIHPDYYHLIDKEIDWYNIVKNHNLSCIPQIYKADKENHEIDMEYLDGYQTLYQYVKSEKDLNKIKDLFKRYLKAIEELHNIKKEEVRYDDVSDDYYKEFYFKVIERCDKISGMLINYNKEDLKKNLQEAINIIFKETLPKDLPFTYYTFCHGDLNGSNVMYNPKTKNIKFIDPRGYFGYTHNVGMPEYDYAKVCYFLSGYDDFNINHYIYTKNNYTEPHKIINYKPKSLKKPIYDIMVGIIWIALAQYISQNIFKANIAYEYGLKILKSALIKYKKYQKYKNGINNTSI